MADGKKYLYGDRLFYTLIKPLLVLLVYLFYPPKVIGYENIPKDGALVFAGNHTKWIDPVLLCAVVKKRQIHFLAKQELFKGLVHIITWGMGAIPVNRSIHDHNALKNAIEGLKSGFSVGIFPEGTINRTSDVIMPFKIGAVKMAHETNSLIVPFVITGDYKLFRRGEIIEFLKPFKVGDDLDKANQDLMNLVKEKLIAGGWKNETK